MKKMKKDERQAYIRARAYELAYNGEGTDWLSIELHLSSEGWSEARRILDRDSIREELDSICKIANSKDEVENRSSFKKWLKEFIVPNITLVKTKYPNVTIHTRENSFSISSSSKELRLTRKFNSRNLLGDRSFIESDGARYVSTNYYESNKIFTEFSIDDLLELVKKIL